MSTPRERELVGALRIVFRPRIRLESHYTKSTTACNLSQRGIALSVTWIVHRSRNVVIGRIQGLLGMDDGKRIVQGVLKNQGSA